MYLLRDLRPPKDLLTSFLLPCHQQLFIEYQICVKYCDCPGLPGWCSGKESTYQHRRCKRYRFDPWVWKISWRRKWQPTLVFLPGEFHGQRSLHRLQSMGSQRVAHDWSTYTFPFQLLGQRPTLPHSPLFTGPPAGSLKFYLSVSEAISPGLWGHRSSFLTSLEAGLPPVVVYECHPGFKSRHQRSINVGQSSLSPCCHIWKMD